MVGGSPVSWAAEKTDSFNTKELFLIFMVSESFMLNMCQVCKSNNDQKLQSHQGS